MNNKEMIVASAFLITGILAILVTISNSKKFMKLCEAYKKKYDYIPASQSSFDYVDFNVANIKMISANKIIYVYFPIIFGRNYSWNKKDKSNWYDFINNYALSFKIRIFIEVALTVIGFILLCVLITFKLLR